IEHLLLSGELPFGSACNECGVEPCEMIHVTTVCERALPEKSGTSWILILLAIFCVPWLFWYFVFAERSSSLKEYGRDKIYPLPWRVCKGCRQKLNNAGAIKKSLCKIPEYQMLLEKFPAANVTISID